MQYTGLKDCKGKEIYEGDILLIPDEISDSEYPPVNPTEPFNHIAEICFDTIGGFGVNIRETGDIFNARFWSFLEIVRETGEAKFECIGNAFENPELLK
jgi:uncharacterized phage protein (TIGR01671 family)